MKDRQLPAWAGGLVGVAGAALLTWLLREGMHTFRFGIELTEIGSVRAGSWLLVLGSGVLAAVMWAGRLHPLITGIPAAWFLIRFAPALFGAFGTPGWYPEWLGRYILPDFNSSSYIVTGLLVVATVAAVLRWRSRPASVLETEQVAS